ncbi:MAG: tRNA pseudouridine(38-40) synthase TruA [Clostridiales Family XIII bacterium]|jgi:tRNA pseudouridine(38-40) synthase|nr:tRNA pseudouridine(38-40) synthase TruA [Clostridiales Family XIII bacterium]
MKRNVLITVEYDGSRFSGWQTQPNARTVHGELMRALGLVCGGEIRLNGTSRTDAGVHAYGQAASLTGAFGIPAERIPIAVNNLTTDVKIVTACEMDETFHARRDAKGKTYLYRISVSGPEYEPDIFMRDYRYQLRRSETICANSSDKLSGNYLDKPEMLSRNDLDASDKLSGNYLDKPEMLSRNDTDKLSGNRLDEIEKPSSNHLDASESQSSVYIDSRCASSPLSIPQMREAAAELIGTHDFSSFRSAGGNPNADPVKTISDITIRGFESADTRGRPIIEYEIRVTGDAFLYNMVRILVGTLVETGTGKRMPRDMAHTLAAKDRQAAGHTAPAAGLWLERVYF